jgi:hypothetical protein
MSKLKPARLLLPLALLFAQTAAAQKVERVSAVPDWRHPATAQTETRRALASMPDAQAVLFVNASRIINEVMPRVMAPADYAKMLNEARKVGFDARGINYVAVGARLADPAPANYLPEFVVVINGNFNADTLLALGRVAAGAQNISPRSETYGSKTLQIIDLESLNKKPAAADGQEAAKPKPMPYPEIAVMALDSDTLVAGVPAYVRALVDAAGGRGTLKPSMVDLATREPQALWSLTVEPPPVLVDYLHKVGAPSNKEFDQMIDWVKQVSLAQGMDALNYTMSASVTTDTPEHASAFSGLVRMGLLAAQTALNSEAAKQTPKHKDYAKTRAALDLVKSFVNRTEGNTLLLSVSAPQKAVHALIKQETASKPTTTAKPGRKARPRRR